MRGLVLSGGGSKGAYQVGALRFLLGTMGVCYDIVAGTSVGAINGAAVCMFSRGKEKEASHHLSQLWGRLTQKTVASDRFLSPLSLAWSPSLQDTAPLRKTLEMELDMEGIKASGKMFRAVAVDRVDGRIGVWTDQDSRESLIRGITASCAAPILYPGEHIDGSLYVDGGIREVVPLSIAIDLGADVLDVLLVESDELTPWSSDPDRVWRTAPRDLEIMLNELIKGDLAQVELHNRLIAAGCGDHGKRQVQMRVVRPSSPLPIDSAKFEPSKIEQVMEMGFQDASEIFA